MNEPLPKPDAADAPRDIQLNLKAQRMVLTWSDDQVSEYDLNALRKACPCASCKQDRAGQQTQSDRKPAAGPMSLPILSIPAGVEKIAVIDARLMGNYAINLRWSDGHDTGIFDYRYLRQLTERCRPAS